MKIDNILIADDHELVMSGISSILDGEFAIGNIVSHTCPHEALGQARKTKFDLYILDLEFETMSGFELIEQLRAIREGAKIIVITMHEELWTIKRLLAEGVDGIIHKRTSHKYLADAVRAVMGGNTFVCPRVERLKAAKRTMLSRSELGVLQYIAQGLSSKQIAEKMHVTENTIETHRKNLFVKLEANNAAHLVTIATQSGLLERKV